MEDKQHSLVGKRIKITFIADSNNEPTLKVGDEATVTAVTHCKYTGKHVWIILDSGSSISLLEDDDFEVLK